MEASRCADYNERLYAIKDVVHGLPRPHYRLLQYLCEHLNHVKSLCEVNKMAGHNLAIVFGPTLIRPEVDDHITMLRDMNHQCTIVESLVTQSDWIFDRDAPPEPAEQ